MDTPTIIALIASLGAGISGIASAITCFFTYRTTRPNLKVEIDKKHCVYTYFQDKSFAFMPLTIRNTAVVNGMVDNIYIKYEGKEYGAEDIYTDYNLEPFKIENIMNDKIKRNTNKLRLKSPLWVKGFSFVEGFIVFPNFPIVQVHSINVRISYRLSNKKFKRFKHVTFSCVTPKPIYNG